MPFPLLLALLAILREQMLKQKKQKGRTTIQHFLKNKYMKISFWQKVMNV